MQGKKKIMVKIIIMILSMNRETNKKMFQGLDLQEIWVKISTETKDLDPMDREIRIMGKIIKMKEADTIMNSMSEIKREIILVKRSMRMVITIIIEAEIIEEIKIGEINLADLLRKLDFHHLISLCLRKRILKVIRMLSSINLKFRMLTMIMLFNIKKNRSMNFTKDIETILGLLKDMIQLKYSNKNKHSKKLAIMKHKDSNKW